MMTNLFSIFDPTSTLMVSNWISMMFWLLFLPPSFFLFKSRISKMFSLVITFIIQEISVITSAPNKHISLIFLSLFVFIAASNSIGLLSYTFTASSHLVFSLSLALPLWLSYILYGVFNKTEKMLAHLVPMGTPPILTPFMVLIETISNIIRPLTLSIRLAANMIAGHLLIALLSGYASLTSTSVTSCVVSSGILLLILESAVAMIQAYVFMVLTALYVNEI